MRRQFLGIALAVLGALNLLFALILPSIQQSLIAQRGMDWMQRRQELIDQGALIENPDAVGGDANEETWLYRELLVYSNRRSIDAGKALIIIVGCHGVLLLGLAVYELRRR